MDQHTYDFTPSLDALDATLEKISQQTLEEIRQLEAGVAEVKEALSSRIDTVRMEINTLAAEARAIVDHSKIMHEASSRLAAQLSKKPEANPHPLSNMLPVEDPHMVKFQAHTKAILSQYSSGRHEAS